MLLKKSRVALRESCFKPIACNSDVDDEVTFDATSGAHKEALLEYIGTGLVDATEDLDRQGLLKDLDAWAVPVSAWPTDLRLRALEADEQAQQDGRVAYQTAWVPAAVEDCLDVARQAQHTEFAISLAPGAGEFEVCLSEGWGGQQKGLVNKEALKSIASQLADKLHVEVLVWPSSDRLKVNAKVANVAKVAKKRRVLVDAESIPVYDHPLSLSERLDRLEQKLGMSSIPEHSSVQ